MPHSLHVLLTFGNVQNPLHLPRKGHLNVRKCPEPGVFCTYWLGNVLRATTACTFLTSQLLKKLRSWDVLYILTSKCFATMACTFSTSELRKVVRRWCVLCVLTSKCASRHNGVQFSSLIWPDGSAPAALASLLFDPPEPQIIEKTWFATFLPFRAPASSFFWLSLLWSYFFFSSLLFSDSSHLCFSSVHIVGGLTSKHPSIIISCLLQYILYYALV